MNAQTTIATREGYIGRTDDGDAVYVKIELTTVSEHPQQTVTHETVTEQTRVSVQGHYFERGSRRKDSTGGGQCIGMLWSVTKPALGFTLDDVKRLAELWGRWHLNDMRAGCAHQTPMYDKRGGYDLDGVDPCPEVGYKFGHAWLYEPVPADVVAELAALAAKLDGEDGYR